MPSTFRSVSADFHRDGAPAATPIDIRRRERSTKAPRSRASAHSGSLVAETEHGLEPLSDCPKVERRR